MEDDGERATDGLVAAFRARKQAQANAAPDPGPDGTPRQVPDARQNVASPPVVASVHEPSPAPPPAPAPPTTALAPAPVAPRALGEFRPGTPPGSPLTVQSLRLSDRLLADRRIAARGLREGRVAGAIALLLAGTMLLAERHLAARPGAGLPVEIAGVSILATAAALSVLGAGTMVLFSFLPRRPALPVQLAASQAEEWDRVQREMKALGLRVPFAWALMAIGVAAAAMALTYGQGLPASQAGAAGGVLLALAGLGLLVHAVAKRSALHRLYVQTLVLSSLERTGLGAQAKDGRVGPVLQALDQLLGALPESTVRRFLATPEAERYLELMDELAQERKDG